MDVDRYLQGTLERLLDEVTVSLRRLEDRDDARVPMSGVEVWRRVERFTGVLEALEVMGEIPEGEVAFWTQRLTDQLEDRGLWSTRTVRLEASASGSIGEVHVTSATSEPVEARPESLGRPELVAVVPVAHRLVEGPGLQVTVVSVELWTDCCTLRWVITGVGDDGGIDVDPTDRRESVRRRHDARQRVAGPDLWAVTDDIGGRYRFAGGGTQGSGPRTTGELLFRPAVRAAATSLTITYRGPGPAAAVTIPLPSER